MQIQLQPAFILHQRTYSETSLLLEVFSINYGKVGIIAKGVKRRSSKYKSLLQIFNPLLLSWVGSGELKTLTGCESGGHGFYFSGKRLVYLVYINEVLMRLLKRCDPHPSLFDLYKEALCGLSVSNLNELELQSVLRNFELALLKELGYAIDLYSETNGDKINKFCSYFYIPNIGFRDIYYIEHKDKAISVTISGENIIALSDSKITVYSQEQMQEIKRLLRFSLQNVLGNKPINSRMLVFKE